MKFEPEKASQLVQEELDRLVRDMPHEAYHETLCILISDLEIRQEVVESEMESIDEELEFEYEEDE